MSHEFANLYARVTDENGVALMAIPEGTPLVRWSPMATTSQDAATLNTIRRITAGHGGGGTRLDVRVQYILEKLRVAHERLGPETRRADTFEQSYRKLMGWLDQCPQRTGSDAGDDDSEERS